MARDRLKKWQITFGILLFISLPIFIVFGPTSLEALKRKIDELLGLGDSSNGFTVFISIASLMTSITAFIGFFFTTVLAWRKEKREAKSFELENQKKELEIIKLKAELDKMQDEKKTIKGVKSK